MPRGYFREAYQKLGRLNADQIVVMIIFALTVLAWFTRPDLVLGDKVIAGWASRWGVTGRVHDGMIAIAASLLLFFLPARTRSQRLLEWDDVQRLPFGIILLFGSGFALALGFERTGLSDWLAERLQGLMQVHPIVLLLAAGLIITVISEFASNIACIQLVLPVVLSLSGDSEFPVRGLMLATTLFASLGFMMPVATPPNTIVYGSGQVRTRDMMRAGFLINLLGIVLISLFIWVRYAG